MEGRSEPENGNPVFECIGLSGGSIVGGCVIGGRNIRIKGPMAQPTRVVGVQGGHHYHANIIGLDGATIGGSSSDEDDVNLKDPGTYFGGKDTGALLIAGKANQKDGQVFLNDIDDITDRLKLLGIKEENIFTVTPGGQGKQARNISRAVEDLADLPIKKFILFYAGHCNNERKFWIDNRENDGYWYPHTELKKCLQDLPATKMLIILDTCYSGSLDMGARGEDEAGGRGGEEGDEEQEEVPQGPADSNDIEMREEGNTTRAVEVFEGRILPFKPPAMPCFWDIFEGKAKSDDGSRGADDTQALQWCSSSSEQRSHNHGGGRNGVFTNAILEYIDGLSTGFATSVLDMHKQVQRNIRLRQTPLLKPDQAEVKSSGFMRTFPRFRKTRFQQL